MKGNLERNREAWSKRNIYCFLKKANKVVKITCMLK